MPSAPVVDLQLNLKFYNRQQLQTLIEAIHAANPGCHWTVKREFSGDDPISEIWSCNGSPVVEYRWREGAMDVNDMREGA